MEQICFKKNHKNMINTLNTNFNPNATTNNKLLYKLCKDGEYSGNECSKVRPGYLNSFFYIDHITNISMAINNDSLFPCNPNYKLRLSHKEDISQNSCRTIKECFDLMKSTRKFHLNSIQAKNYKNKLKVNSSILNQKIDCQESQQKLSREKLDKYVRYKKNQKQKYLEDKSILGKMLQNPVNNKKSTKSVEKNVQQANQNNRLTFPQFKTQGNSISEQQKKEQKKQKSKQQPISSNIKQLNKICKKKINRKRRYNKQNKPQQNQINENNIIDNVNSQVRYFVRKNGQFLITPKLSKRLIPKGKQNNIGKMSYNSFGEDEKILRNTFSLNRFKDGEDQHKFLQQKPKFFNRQQLDKYTFKIDNQDVLNKRLNLKMEVQDNKREKKQKIIQLIQQGNFFKAQIQISLNPKLLQIKQKQNNNNLLHVCIMNNKVQIFRMIFQKCRENKVDLLSQKNKYGRNPIQLANILSFFTKEQIEELVQINRVTFAFGILQRIFVD